MKVRLLVPAAAELEEAVAWYRAEAPALDQRFLAECVRAAGLLLSTIMHGTRLKAACAVFAFAIFLMG
jgi:hypothetical protein